MTAPVVKQPVMKILIDGVHIPAITDAFFYSETSLITIDAYLTEDGLPFVLEDVKTISFLYFSGDKEILRLDYSTNAFHLSLKSPSIDAAYMDSEPEFLSQMGVEISRVETKIHMIFYGCVLDTHV